MVEYGELYLVKGCAIFFYEICIGACDNAWIVAEGSAAERSENKRFGSVIQGDIEDFSSAPDVQFIQFFVR